MSRPWRFRNLILIMIVTLTGTLALGFASPPSALAQIFSRPKVEPKQTPSRRETTQRRERKSSSRKEAAAKEPEPAPVRASFDNPVDYCAYYLDVDALDDAYVGEPTPEWIRTAMPPMSEAQQIFWRCGSGRIMACQGPMGSDSEGGRCAKASDPKLADARGYVGANWNDITGYEARFKTGDVAGQYLGERQSLAEGKDFSEDDYIVSLNITGGALNEIVGEVSYATPSEGGENGERVCTSRLRLVAVSDTAISLNQESESRRKDPCRASRQLILQAVGSSARLQSFEVRGSRRERKMEVWFY
ncbi:hypothetical protein B2G71_03195 [Novosphingobium sp. PC22D]|nr:hypothetical protein B2G71_03195 [Novosphingobium sp. PC22D]